MSEGMEETPEKGRIAQTFARLHTEERKALIVYLTAGDPSFQQSLLACQAAIEAGADILEIGVPFSDPVADGPTIQLAMQRALAAGGGLSSALQLVKKLREHSQIPIVLFGYLNPLLWYGFDETCARAVEAGVDAFLVVDAPPKEAQPLQKIARAHGLDWIALVTPTTPSQRLEDIDALSTGFVYLVSMLGVTGGTLNTGEDDRIARLRSQIESMRPKLKHPICVGFGIRDRQDVQRTAQFCDGVIAGSVIIEALERGIADNNVHDNVSACVRELRAGL